MDQPTLERCTCLLTGRDDGVASDAIAWRGVTLPFVLCPATGLQYMNPRPTAAWYRQHYAEAFWPEHTTDTGYSHKGRSAMTPEAGTSKRLAKQLWRARRIQSRVAAAVTLGPDDVIVDIGSAFGVTPALLTRETGAEAWAVEPSEMASAFATQRLGVPLLARFVEELHQPTPLDGRVSLFVLSHVLENLLDPLAMLQTLRGKLRPGGHLYIDTPNFFYCRAANPYHPYVFNPHTLARLLAAAGLRVVAAHHDPHPSEADSADDPYLAVVATPGDAVIEDEPIDPSALMSAQQQGLELLRTTKAKRKQEAAAAGRKLAKQTPTAKEVEAFLALAPGVTP